MTHRREDHEGDPDPLDVHQAITDRIVASIEEGSAGTFRMPWNQAGASGLPTNIASGKHYNGINILALWVASLSLGYTRPIWGTYRQWRDKGAQVRKGEKPRLSCSTRPSALRRRARKARRRTARPRHVRRARPTCSMPTSVKYAPIDPFPAQPRFEPMDAGRAFREERGSRHSGRRQHGLLLPAQDVIRMPDRVRFNGTATMSAGEAYYATLMHELTHWTGLRAVATGQ